MRARVSFVRICLPCRFVDVASTIHFRLALMSCDRGVFCCALGFGLVGEGGVFVARLVFFDDDSR